MSSIQATSSSSSFYSVPKGLLVAGVVGGVLALLFYKRMQFSQVTTLDLKNQASLLPSSVMKSNASDWVRDMPKKPTVAISPTDAGNDTDDVGSHVVAAQLFGNDLRLVTTTLDKPDEKAKISSLVFKYFGIEAPIVPGYGVYKGEKVPWMDKYPCWPQKFGIPGSTNRVSLFQSLAYRKYFPDFENIPISSENASQALIQLSKKEGKNLIIIAQAPFTDLALALKEDPKWLSGVNRIVMMGGWFEDEQGGILRLGYNTAVDLKASKAILTQTQTPVLIVSSQLVKKYHFYLRDKEREAFLASSKSQLGKAICEDMHNYWENKVPPKGELCLADVLTVYLAKHPEAIILTQPVELSFNDNLLNIDMFHPNSKDVINVRKVEKSNIHLISELRNPDAIRSYLVAAMLAPLFSPQMKVEIVQKAITEGSTPEEIIEIMNRVQSSKL